MACRPKTTKRRGAAQAIMPTALYTRAELPGVMRMGLARVEEEIKAGRLRVRQVGGCYLILGQWVIDWAKAQPSQEPM